MEDIASFDHLEKPQNLNELHHSLTANLNIIAAKSSKLVDVSWRNKNQVVVRAKLTNLDRKKLNITIMPDILLSQNAGLSKTLAVDVKCFSHSATNRHGYFVIKLVQKDVEDQLKLYSETPIKAPPETFYAASRVLETA